MGRRVNSQGRKALARASRDGDKPWKGERDCLIALRKQAPLVYLYGFTPAAVCFHPAAHGVEEGVRVECLEHQGISALISLVPASVYEEQPLEERFKDPCWLALRVERHNRVLLGALEHAAVAPCRFGTLFRSTTALKEIIARHRATLAKVLRKLEGRQEWSVKAYCSAGFQPAALSAGVPPASPSSDVQPTSHTAGGQLAPGAAGGPPIHPRRPPTPGGNRGEGSAYLLGLVRQRTARQQAAEQVHAHAQRITAALAKLAEDMAPLALRSSENGKETIFLNLACLVKRGEAGALIARLAKLAAREKKANITLTWSGPWPAYSFAGGLFETEPHMSTDERFRTAFSSAACP